jgi:hypothetical protein
VKLKEGVLLFFAFALASCGYRFTPSQYEGERMSLSIPYIQGDPEALFNSELSRVFASSGRFDCLQSGGDYTLGIVLLSDTNDRIGYRYDRDDATGRRKPNILAVENRRNILAQVTLYDSHSGDVILGPMPIKASSDYDYADPGSPKDVVTYTPYGPVPSIRYSYGQLNTVEGAHDDCSPKVYTTLSQKILQAIENQMFR